MTEHDMPPKGGERNIIPFIFEGESFRALTIDDSPWFVAKDVCAFLGLKNITEALRCLDDDERGSVILNTSGGPQEVIVISEPGFYKLCGRSRKPGARALDRWVRHDVLPALRKGGSYSMSGNAKSESPPELPDAAENDNLKLRKVSVVKDLFGNKVGRQMWFKLGLDTVPAMFEAHPQGELFDPPPQPDGGHSITITIPTNGSTKPNGNGSAHE